MVKPRASGRSVEAPAASVQLSPRDVPAVGVQPSPRYASADVPTPRGVLGGVLSSPRDAPRDVTHVGVQEAKLQSPKISLQRGRAPVATPAVVQYVARDVSESVSQSAFVDVPRRGLQTATQCSPRLSLQIPRSAMPTAGVQSSGYASPGFLRYSHADLPHAVVQGSTMPFRTSTSAMTAEVKMLAPASPIMRTRSLSPEVPVVRIRSVPSLDLGCHQSLDFGWQDHGLQDDLCASKGSLITPRDYQVRNPKPNEVSDSYQEELSLGQKSPLWGQPAPDVEIHLTNEDTLLHRRCPWRSSAIIIFLITLPRQSDTCKN